MLTMLGVHLPESSNLDFLKVDLIVNFIPCLSINLLFLNTHYGKED